MNNTIQIDIPVASIQECEIMIAHLSEINFYAFRENETILSAFIKEEHFDEKRLRSNLPGSVISYTKIILPDTNWNQIWENEFNPVIINDFVAIRAAFHPAVKTMLQQMKAIDFNNTNVLDFGTGTGVLAIMAKKLGAKAITAIDNDDWSIINAKENFHYNNCEEINLIKKDLVNDLSIYDIILTYISLNVIIANIEGFKQVSHASTILLLSGFLWSDQKKLITVCEKASFQCETISQKDDWICVKLQRA